MTAAIRQATPEDIPFMEEMTYLAAFSINGELPAGTPSPVEAREIDWIAEYIAGWGRESDFGLIATNDNGDSIAAAWYRHYQTTVLPADQITLAVQPEHHHQGIGRQLLSTLMHTAHQNGLEEISLQVNPANTNAKSLYEQLGFVVIEHTATTEVMTAPLGVAEAR